MGTRHLTCVVVDKKFKVAQYGQWDGYIEGQGKTIINFIRDDMDLKRFKAAVRECRWLKAKDVRQTWVNAGDKSNNKSSMVSMDIADKHAILYPGLNRDTGAQILSLIQDGTFKKTVKVHKGDDYGWKEKTFTCDPVRGLVNEKAFAKDSLFCEWAYVVDLDKETLEIYQGFNQGSVKGRFASLKRNKGNQYTTITLWRTLTFDEVREPGKMEALQAEYQKEIDEEDA